MNPIDLLLAALIVAALALAIRRCVRNAKSGKACCGDCAACDMLVENELRKSLSGHPCRCAGCENIFRAVQKAIYRRHGKEIDF